MTLAFKSSLLNAQRTFQFLLLGQTRTALTWHLIHSYIFWSDLLFSLFYSSSASSNDATPCSLIGCRNKCLSFTQATILSKIGDNCARQGTCIVVHILLLCIKAYGLWWHEDFKYSLPRASMSSDRGLKLDVETYLVQRPMRATSALL